MRRRCSRISGSFAKAVVFALGAFATLCSMTWLWQPELDMHLWWIDLRPIEATAQNVALGFVGVLFLRTGVMPTRSRLLVGLSRSVAGLLALVALYNAWTYWRLCSEQTIGSEAVVPWSLLVAIALLLVAVALPRDASSQAYGRRGLFSLSFAVVVSFASAPLGQMHCFGRTDYRRPADAILVFGCRAFADGTPSDALAERVRTACQLFREGRARWVVFSGGPGDGPVHETEAMARFARRLGVPASAMLLDREGLNTRCTARRIASLAAERGWSDVLAVSHSYHLPRIKLACQHAGMDVWTVPATERFIQRNVVFQRVREVAAFWYYWGRQFCG